MTAPLTHWDKLVRKAVRQWLDFEAADLNSVQEALALERWRDTMMQLAVLSHLTGNCTGDQRCPTCVAEEEGLLST
jgi:hypothetical protein